MKKDDKTTDKDPKNDKSKNDSVVKKAGEYILNATKKYALTKTIKIMDEFFLGQVKDAILDIFGKQKLDSLDEDGLKKMEQDLLDSDEYKKNADNVNADSRQDKNKDFEVDPLTEQFQLMWYTGDKSGDIKQIMSNLTATIQKQAKEVENQLKDIKSRLQKMKIKDISDDDISKYGTVLKQMLDDKKSAKEIQNKLQQLKKEVNEAVQKKMLLSEAETLSEEQKTYLPYNCLFESETFITEMEYMLTEGWLKNLGSKIADTSKKALATVGKKSIGPILGLAGLSVSVLTGGAIPTILIKAMDFLEKNGKQLRNSFERVYTTFKNSKGIITRMNFKTKNNKSEYSLRFYQKDMVWRLLNTSDQLKHPSIDQIKGVLDSTEGQRYRKRIKEIWDPLFSSSKGGKVDFVEILKQAKSLNIKEEILKEFQTFRENYKTISQNCIESPKIDTRTQK